MNTYITKIFIKAKVFYYKSVKMMTRKKMIIDSTGTILTPVNGGERCCGNGKYSPNKYCCDECDYFMCCAASHQADECNRCTDNECPHSTA